MDQKIRITVYTKSGRKFRSAKMVNNNPKFVESLILKPHELDRVDMSLNKYIKFGIVGDQIEAIKVKYY